MKKKNVLINASMMSDTPTGVGVYGNEVVFRLIKYLEENNIGWKCYNYNHIQIKGFYDIKLPTFLDGFFSKFRALHRLLWNIFYLPFIARNYDLVYSFSTHGSPFIKKQIITVHDVISLNFPGQHRFQYYYFKYLVPRILKCAKHIIAISNFTKSEIKNYYKNIDADFVSVIYNGSNHLNSNITEDNINLGKVNELTNGRPYFLTVGASYEHKNIEIILEAAKVLDDNLFIIVGSNTHYLQKLKRMKDNLKLSNVIFLNYVESAFLKELYKNAKANLYPSLYEGFGFTPIEASLFGCVSVVSNSSSLPEIYQDSVIYISASSKDLVCKLEYVNSTSFDKNKYLKNFKQLYQRYDWDKSCKAILNLILKYIN